MSLELFPEIEPLPGGKARLMARVRERRARALRLTIAPVGLALAAASAFLVLAREPDAVPLELDNPAAVRLGVARPPVVDDGIDIGPARLVWVAPQG